MIFRTKKGVRFIDYMLDMIENSIYKFIGVASETMNGGGIVRETTPLDLNNPDLDIHGSCENEISLFNLYQGTVC